MRATSAFGNVFAQSTVVTIKVGASRFSTCAPSGVRPSLSSTTRSGLRPAAYSGFTVSFGSSARIVPTPTSTASQVARSWWTRRRSSSSLIRVCFRVGSAIFPSTDIAKFTSTCGGATVARTGAQYLDPRAEVDNPRLPSAAHGGIEGDDRDGDAATVPGQGLLGRNGPHPLPEGRRDRGRTGTDGDG